MTVSIVVRLSLLIHDLSFECKRLKGFLKELGWCLHVTVDSITHLWWSRLPVETSLVSLYLTIQVNGLPSFKRLIRGLNMCHVPFTWHLIFLTYKNHSTKKGARWLLQWSNHVARLQDTWYVCATTCAGHWNTIGHRCRCLPWNRQKRRSEQSRVQRTC